MYREECEMNGGIWVESHTTIDGTYVRGYCRKQDEQY